MKAEWFAAWGQWVGAAATTGAVVIALFQDRISAWMNPHRLSLRLYDDLGMVTYDRESERVSRWFHLEVSVPDRRIPIEEVRIYLVSLAALDARDGEMVIARGPIPLPWRATGKHEGKKIGPPAEADFCVLSERRSLIVCSDLHGGGIAPLARGNYLARVRADGLTTSSRELEVEIRWNGEWALGDDEIGRNLTFHVRGSKPRRAKPALPA
jgi:hypothetical protein